MSPSRRLPHQPRFGAVCSSAPELETTGVGGGRFAGEGGMRNISLQTRPAHNTGAKPSEPPVKADGDARPLVVVDPGHGGIDNGTKGSGGELEKDIVLAFSQALREKLESGGKYRVAMRNNCGEERINARGNPDPGRGNQAVRAAAEEASLTSTPRRDASPN